MINESEVNMKTKVNKLSSNERTLYNIYSQLTSPVLQEKEVSFLEEQREAIHEDAKAAKALCRRVIGWVLRDRALSEI